MTERSYRGWLWALALLGLLADQGTKYGVFHWLYNNGEGGERAIIPGAFNFLAQFTPQRDPGNVWQSPLRTLSGDALPRVNHGALFGMAAERGHLANSIFMGISFVAATAILFWSTRRKQTTDWLLCVALGLILGGTLGNLYDRAVFHGVRDFLHWYYIYDWPVFNIADVCLVVGAFLLMVQAIFMQPALTQETTPPVEAEPAAIE
ncbi:MAG: signal peptidase II [Planctomycetia bacterium]|nr:signal peptidase II [Planctomycetia bacterium]